MKTYTVAGILVGDDCYTDLKAAKSFGQDVMQKVIPVTDTKCCHNCGGGEGYLYFGYALKVRGEHSMSWYSPVWNRWVDVDSRAYPCPVCNADAPTRIELLWGESGLEPAERGWHLDYVKDMPGKVAAWRAAVALLQTPYPTGWLTLYGDHSRGKSGLLKATVASLIRMGTAARYVRAEDVLGELRATFRDDARASEAEIKARYGSLPFLAIDEIDRVSDTGWSRAALFALLDHRYDARHRACTLLATNQHPDKLSGLEYLSARMTDGLRIPMGGDSLRGVAQPRPSPTLEQEPF